jgi:DNA-binding MarR family transcriptional regulator
MSAEPGATAANRRIGDGLLRLTHVMNRFRASLAASQGEESEWMQNQLLFRLATSGPMRSSALAESVQADPSTVSRQVAALVRAGLIERRADPDDGRATLLVLTDSGHTQHQRHLDRRDVHYAQMLAHWSVADRNTFAELIARFTDDFDTYKSAILAEVCAQRAPASREEHQ